MHSKTCKHIFLFSLAGLFFIIDRLLKWYAITVEPFGFTYLGFEYFENTGIAFSIPVPQSITLILTPIIVIALLHYMHDTTDRIRWFAWILICTGAFSNFIDRILFGYVIDYIRIGTAIINIADIIIVIGILLFLRKHTSEVNMPS
jgi:signal peptidase II